MVPLAAAVCDEHGVLRLAGLRVLLFTLFASLSSWEYLSQLKGRVRSTLCASRNSSVGLAGEQAVHN